MFHKILASVISLTLGVLPFMPPLRIGAADGNEIFVAPDGNDLADGTIGSPLATIFAAKEKAKSLSGNVTVYFRGGSYTIDSPVQFDGSDKSDVVYKAYKDEKVTFTSGTPYTGFDAGRYFGLGIQKITCWNYGRYTSRRGCENKSGNRP